MLLAIVTALTVARLLVAAPAGSPASLILLFLWLTAAVGWAVWLLTSQQAGWRGGLVEVGLLTAAGFAFASAGQAASGHVAWLSAWEGLGLFLMVVLVRNLVETDEESRGLLAALLATGVCLAGQSIYQVAVHGNESSGRRVVPVDPAPFLPPPDDLGWQFGPDETSADSRFVPFTQPHQLALLLGMLTPALLGAVVRGWNGRAWHAAALALCILVVAMALLLLMRASGIAVVPVVLATGLACFSLRRPRPFMVGLKEGRMRLGPWLAVAWVAGGVSLLLWDEGQASLRDGLRLRRDAWTAALGMAGDRPWLGVGPGLFQPYAARYLPDRVLRDLPHPFSGYLEVVATAGFLTLLPFVLALLAFLRRVPIRSEAERPPRGQGGQGEPSGRAAWEYYLGGMAGLLLGFVLSTRGRPPQEILPEAVLAGVRSVAWFAAFALFAGLPLSRQTQGRLAAAGVVTVLLAWLVMDGVSVPALMQPLGVLMALALNAVPQGAVRPSTILRSLVLPVAAAACLGFGVVFLMPVIGPAPYLREALREGRAYRAQLKHHQEDQARPEPDREIKNSDRSAYLKELRKRLEGFILPALNEAARVAGSDARIHCYLAQWYVELWRSDPSRSELAVAAAWHAARAILLDPEQRAGYLAEYRLRMLLAKYSDGAGARDQLDLAADAARQLVAHEPSDPRLRFMLATALSRAGKEAEARRQAREANDCNRTSLPEDRQLSAEQRKQVQTWLEPGGHSQGR